MQWRKLSPMACLAYIYTYNLQTMFDKIDPVHKQQTALAFNQILFIFTVNVIKVGISDVDYYDHGKHQSSSKDEYPTLSCTIS